MVETIDTGSTSGTGTATDTAASDITEVSQTERRLFGEDVQTVDQTESAPFLSAKNVARGGESDPTNVVVDRETVRGTETTGPAGGVGATPGEAAVNVGGSGPTGPGGVQVTGTGPQDVDTTGDSPDETVRDITEDTLDDVQDTVQDVQDSVPDPQVPSPSVDLPTINVNPGEAANTALGGLAVVAVAGVIAFAAGSSRGGA